MHLLADIANGNTSAADVLFLIGCVLFVIVAALEAMAKNVAGAVLAIGLAAVALAWLLL